MKLTFLSALAAVAMIFSANAQAAPTVGEMAPEFTAVDSNGNSHNLSDFRGKTVVLEWTNNECPFVVKHYGSGNMQKLQKEATDKDVVWLSIHSSAEGKQGHVNGEQANAVAEEQGANATAQLLDASGDIGRLYNAKTTPHMFVVDADGNLAYAGAIDSDSSFKPEAIEGATNYVMAAIDSLAAGTEIEVSSTKPYGCSVKY
ncbi:MAG: thioredoxin family protein [Alphaproteobacteria bacterium]|nr:thioredoxin family protein [Alphaproteobacteria bacterium]